MSIFFCKTESVVYNARTNSFHVFNSYFLLSISLRHQSFQQGNEGRFGAHWICYLSHFSINLLVVYRESVNLIGYNTRRLSADSQQL